MLTWDDATDRPSLPPAIGGPVRAGVKLVTASFASSVVRPVRDAVRTRRGRHPVRIFTFHRISDRWSDPLTIAPGDFRMRVEYLQRHHDVVDLGEALELLESGARLARPVAALTFDDGYRSVLTRAAPILEELGLTASCFVCTDLVGTSRRLPHDAHLPPSADVALMDWREVRELRDRGWTIGAHTATHPRLSDTHGASLRRELVDPLRVLRERLGPGDIVLAYPFGGRNDISGEALRAARDVGYRACLSNYGGENLWPADFQLLRIDLGGELPETVWRLWAQGMSLRPWRRPRRRRLSPPPTPVRTVASRTS